MKNILKFNEFVNDLYINECIDKYTHLFDDTVNEAKDSVDLDDPELKKMHLYYLIRYAKRFNDKGKFTDRQLEVIAAELRSHESAADITPIKGSKLDKSKEKDPAQFNKYVKLMGDLTKKYTEAVKAVKKGDINKVIDIAKTYDKLVSKETEVYNKLINND